MPIDLTKLLGLPLTTDKPVNTNEPAPRIPAPQRPPRPAPRPPVRVHRQLRPRRRS